MAFNLQDFSKALYNNQVSTYQGSPQEIYRTSTPASGGQTTYSFNTNNSKAVAPNLYTGPSTGQVLGDSTSGGGGGNQPNPGPRQDGSYINEFGQWTQPSQQPQLDMSAYFSALDEAMNGLNSQSEAQQGIVRNQYQQGVNTLTAQKEQGLRDLGAERTKTETTQTKTMKELADAMRDQFMSGQVMLGARGAGDSSAANQYSYALTKAGNKQRGDLASTYAGIQSEIGDREFKLKSTYDNEINNIALERDSKLNQVTQWLGEQQNQIRMMKAQGRADMAMATYNQAIQMANQINTEASNRRNMLEQWAMNNAQNIQQLASNLQGISSYQANPPAFQGLNTNLAMGGNTTNTPSYGGQPAKDEDFWSSMQRYNWSK